MVRYPTLVDVSLFGLDPTTVMVRGHAIRMRQMVLRTAQWAGLTVSVVCQELGRELWNPILHVDLEQIPSRA